MTGTPTLSPLCVLVHPVRHFIVRLTRESRTHSRRAAYSRVEYAARRECVRDSRVRRTMKCRTGCTSTHSGLRVGVPVIRRLKGQEIQTLDASQALDAVIAFYVE